MRRVKQETFVVEPPRLVVVPNFIGIIIRFMVAFHDGVWHAKPQVNVAHFRQTALTLLAVSVLLVDVINSCHVVLMQCKRLRFRLTALQPKSSQVLTHLVDIPTGNEHMLDCVLLIGCGHSQVINEMAGQAGGRFKRQE